MKKHLFNSTLPDFTGYQRKTAGEQGQLAKSPRLWDGILNVNA
jgi:hypothetical protein